jgi:uncharacterized protein YfdQ (DUF2303 family)
MTTEAKEIADLAVKAAGHAHFVKSEDGREFLVLPAGHAQSEVTLPNSLPLYEPHYIKECVILQTTNSLVEYVNRYKTDDTVLFADIGENRIVGQIDYHAPAKAGHNAHRAMLQLSFSTEWAAWIGISGQLNEQLEFARFIEENGADVRAPTGAELLECVRDLQANRSVNFTKAVRTSSDNENFEYSEATETRSRKGGVEVPTKFQLGIPVYFGEGDIELHAFLRWKLSEGNLKLGVQLHRAEHVRQAVFQAIVWEIADRTGCPAVFGKLSGPRLA